MRFSQLNFLITKFCVQRKISVHFSLQGTILGMTRRQYEKIIANDEECPSEKKPHFKPYSYIIPNTSEFVSEDSSDSPRRINIMASIISQDWVWVIVDWSRMARCHLTLRKRPWTASDFRPESAVGTFCPSSYISSYISEQDDYARMFSPFAGGPDWIDERQRALDCLDRWRNDAIEAGEEYRKKLDKWNTTYLPEFAHQTPSTLQEHLK